MGMWFGVLVIGAPGAGKSTFCAGLSDVFKQLKRPFAVMNLDPANDSTSYDCDFDIKELISVEEVMDRLGLGPNGALRYCMQTLAGNPGWLINKMNTNSDKYFIIDCPGQLELYRSEGELDSLISQVEAAGGRLCAVHLMDCLYCSDPSSFISVVISALSAMVALEMPHINVLSKADLFDHNLPYDLEFYTQLPSVERLVDILDNSPILSRYRGLNRAIAEVVDNKDLVNFLPLDVSSKEDMARLLVHIDKANGFALVEKNLREIVLQGT